MDIYKYKNSGLIIARWIPEHPPAVWTIAISGGGPSIAQPL